MFSPGIAKSYVCRLSCEFMSSTRKNVFLIGVGGTAMGSLAVELVRRGWRVGGSDGVVYEPMSGILRAAGIPVFGQEDVAEMNRWSGSVFIVGNAVSRGHPQVEWLLDHPSEVRMSMSGFMEERVLHSTRNLVVAGTHGKSTTSAAAAWYLRSQGGDPGWCVGGVVHDLPCGFHWPENGDGPFVLEGDEYDTAFFDKRSKFVHYRPQVLVLNNLEFDHADIFRDLEDVKRSFRQVIALIPSGGVILYNGDDPELSRLLPVNWTRCLSFGLGSDNNYPLEATKGAVTVRDQDTRGRSWVLQHSLSGIFNARNLAGAFLGACHLTETYPPADVDFRKFRGLRRRAEIRVENDRVVLVEDFAHHPTAIAATLEALREDYPKSPIGVILEARSNTLRTRRLQGELIVSLCRADSVFLAPVHRELLLAKEERLDRKQVLEALDEKGISCQNFDDFAAIPHAIERLLADTPSRQILVVFSNGAFGGILPQLDEICKM